jgi:hypothetical protein
MTYDPYQTNSALGAYAGLATPFQSPYTSLSPAAAFNPLAAGYSPIAGIHPQLHLAQMLAARTALPQSLAASPWTTGLNHPLLASAVLNNPLLASAVLQNPLLAATLENPLMNPFFGQTPFGVQPNPFNPYASPTVPQLGQIPPQFGQIGSPYGQIPPQFGQIGSPYGQIPPQVGQLGSPYGQIPPQVGQLGTMLAPQSWVGQPGLYGSHPLGQVHPLISQLIGRGFPGAGIFPTSL